MFKTLSLRSKLIALLLGVSLLASGIVIVLGGIVGTESISREVYERLTSVRNAKAFEVEDYLENLSRVTETLADDPTTADALLDFSNAYLAIENSDTINCTADLADFYEGFLDRLGQNMEVRREIDAFYPRQPAACYLQYHYMLDSLGNGDRGSYAVAHDRYHTYYTGVQERFGLYDIFLIDAATNSIVYTVEKEVDFATSLTDGPYRNSNLGQLVEEVRRNADLRGARVQDFAFYRPSLGHPAAFMGAPVIRDNNLIGVVAIQLSIDRLNYLMNYGGEWEANGLGKTGEVLLVGADRLLRSNNRRYLEDREQFVQLMRAGTEDREELRQIEQLGPIKVVELRSDNIDRAIDGKRGILQVTGYHDQEVLSAYTPLHLPGNLDWVLVAEMDADEAMAPVARFRRLNFSALAFIIALITVLAMLATRILIRPIDRLTRGAEQVSAGDTAVRVEKTTEDELGRLTEVFNAMVGSIDAQKEEIRRQATENESLLYSRFPASIAERFRNGETTIVDHFEGVTVISCDIRGNVAQTEADDTEAWGMVQELSEKASEVATELGIEVVHPVPDGYLAVCGMNIPRLDNGRRVVIFAMRLQEIVRQINRKYEVELTVNVGLSQGTVLAGVLQNEGNHYVVWGATVDEAQRLTSLSQLNQIYATDPLVELLEGNFAFTDREEVVVAKDQTVGASRLLGRVTDLAAAAAQRDKSQPA